MKVVVSRRFARELDRLFQDGVLLFGERVASTTFLKIDRALRETLAVHPYLGRFLPARNVLRYAVPSTPFVIYYQIRTDRLVAIAIRHGAQDRKQFEA